MVEKLDVFFLIFLLTGLNACLTLSRMSDNGNEIADKIEYIRLKFLWTYKELSKRTGISIATLQKIEERKVKPHKLTVAKLKKYLPQFFK